MTYEFYKVLHLVAILFLFTSIGSLTALGRSGAGTTLRRLAAIVHGVSLGLVVVAGFGLLAKLGIMGDFPIWVWLKLGVWLLVAFALIPLRRRPEWAVALWVVLPTLAGVAAWLAVNKPI